MRARAAAALAAEGFRLGQRAFIRIFKRERLLELWLGGEPQFSLFRSYQILGMSGVLGPKLAEGDRQAPEGFYRVAEPQLNPHSRHHLAFNLGFPNSLDTQLGRTGSALMVHGGTSSVGCYAIGDAPIEELYAVVEAALAGGQQAVDVHCFPFRLTPAELAGMAGHPALDFWQDLAEGFQRFEGTRVPANVSAENGRYRFEAGRS